MKRQAAVLSAALAVTFVGLAVVSSNAQQTGPPTGTLCVAHGFTEQRLVDEFDRTALNTTVWSPYGEDSDWPGHSNNGLRVARAISVHDGMADIRAHEVNNVIESGAFTARTGFRYIYGCYETRLRVDDDPSQTMSAVALLWNVDETAHPWCQGESDFYETGTTRDDWQTFLHWEPASNVNCGDSTTQEHCTHLLDPRVWHDVVLEWEASRYAVYVDGALDCTITDPAKIPQWPQRLTFQYDAFDPDMGSVDTHFLIDRAAIYQR
jgi:beta-glucanase (GH16 family)